MRLSATSVGSIYKAHLQKKALRESEEPAASEKPSSEPSRSFLDPNSTKTVSEAKTKELDLITQSDTHSFQNNLLNPQLFQQQQSQQRRLHQNSSSTLPKFCTVETSSITNTVSSFTPNFSGNNSVFDSESITSSLAANPFNQNVNEHSPFDASKFPLPSPSQTGTETDFTVNNTPSSIYTNASGIFQDPQSDYANFNQNDCSNPLHVANDLNRRSNVSNSDKRYAFQFDDFDLDLLDSEDFLADFKPATSESATKFPITSLSESGTRVTFLDQYKPAKSFSNDALLDSFPQKGRVENSWRSDNELLTDYDDPSKLTIGTDLVPFKERRNSEDALEKNDPIGQRRGASFSTTARKRSGKNFSKSQDNILGPSRDKQLNEPVPTLHKFPSEHSTEARTPHSAAFSSSFNNNSTLFEFPLEIAPTNSTESQPAELSPAPKFPLQINFNQILGLEQKDLFEDHDYSVPKKELEKTVKIQTVDSNSTQEEKQKGSQMSHMRSFSGSFTSTQYPAQSQQQSQFNYSAWGMQTPYDNPNKVQSPQTPGFPNSFSTQKQSSQSSYGKAGINQGPIPFRANQRPALPGSTDFPSFNYGRNRNRFQFSPIESQPPAYGNGEHLFTSPPYVKNKPTPVWSTSSQEPQNISGSFKSQQTNSTLLQTFSPPATVVSKITEDRTNEANDRSHITTFHRSTSSFGENSSTQGQTNNASAFVNRSSLGSATASPNQGTFQPNGPTNPGYNFQTFESTNDSKKLQLREPEKTDAAPEQASSLFDRMETDFAKTNGMDRILIKKEKTELIKQNGTSQNISQTQKTEKPAHQNFELKNHATVDGGKKKAEELKADIKHHFLDAAPSTDQLNRVDKGPLTEDEKKKVQMYATLRKYKQRSQSFSTSVPNISKHISSERLNWKSTDNLSGKGSESGLKDTLDTLRSSMKNLLQDGAESGLQTKNSATPPIDSGVRNNGQKSSTLISTKRDPVLIDHGLRAQGRTRAQSESAKKSTETFSQLAPEFNLLSSHQSSDMRNVEEWIDRNSMSELSQAGISKKSAAFEEVEEAEIKRENQKQPQRSATFSAATSSSNYPLPHKAVTGNFAMGNQHNFGNRQDVLTSERPLSPQSTNSLMSDFSRPSDRMSSLRRQPEPNHQQETNIEVFREQELTSDNFLGNRSLHKSRITEAFRNPFGELTGHGHSTTKSLYSSPPSERAEKSQFQRSHFNQGLSTQPREFSPKSHSSSQDLNQLFNSRTPLSSLNVGLASMNSAASDFAPQRESSVRSPDGALDQRANNFGPPRHYGSLHRGATLQNTRLSRAPQQGLTADRSKSM